MDESVKKIIQNLEKAKSNRCQEKQGNIEIAKILGNEVEDIDLQINAWEDVGEKNEKVTPFISIALEFSKKIVEQSEKSRQRFNQYMISASHDSTMSIIDTASTLAASAVAFSSDEQNKPLSYTRLVEFIDRKDYRSEISRKLLTIDPLLAEKYKNVWNSSSLSQDYASSMFGMRQIMWELYKHFASDKDVKNYCENEGIEYLNKEGRIKHSARIKFISSKIIDKNTLSAFLAEEKAFVEIINKLSYAKKRTEINNEKAKNILNQANALIRLFLTSIEKI